MALTIYHLERSRSDRIIWLAEELGLGYELVRFERDPHTLRAEPCGSRSSTTPSDRRCSRR